MDNDIKISKYYDGGKMRRAVMLMEQFWALSQDPALDVDNRKAALAMDKHFQRLALCIAAKEMPEDHGFDRVIDEQYMKNMYTKYQEQS